MQRMTVLRNTLLAGAACLALGWPAAWAGPEGDDNDGGQGAEEAARARLFETYHEGAALSPEEQWKTWYLAERLRRGRAPAMGTPEPEVGIPLARLARPRRFEAGIATCLAQGAGGDLPDACRLGRALSRMRPCLDADDCPAFEAWQQLYGPPEVVPAAPAERPAPDAMATRDD